MIKKLMGLTVVALLMASYSFADTVQNGTGLNTPNSVITFDEHILANGTLVTNQYAAEGVTFSPFLRFYFILKIRYKTRPTASNPSKLPHSAKTQNTLTTDKRSRTPSSGGTTSALPS